MDTDPTDAVITVRDHRRQCEHGSLWAHWLEVRKAKWWQNPDCPGGVAMTLQRVEDGHWQEVGRPAR